MELKLCTIHNPIGIDGRGIRIVFKPRQCSVGKAHEIFTSFCKLVNGHKLYSLVHKNGYVTMEFAYGTDVSSLIQWILLNEED